LINLLGLFLRYAKMAKTKQEEEISFWSSTTTTKESEFD
jgi:hypothetical protein